MLALITSLLVVSLPPFSSNWIFLGFFDSFDFFFSFVQFLNLFRICFEFVLNLFRIRSEFFSTPNFKFLNFYDFFFQNFDLFSHFISDVIISMTVWTQLINDWRWWNSSEIKAFLYGFLKNCTKMLVLEKNIWQNVRQLITIWGREIRR